MPSPFLLVPLGAAFGAAVGSFSGVVASRGWRGALRGRSYCDACRRPLRWFELVPVLSFVALGGRCRTCRSRLGYRLLAYETVGALVVVLICAAIAVAVRNR
jgi:leader peptidase (prepilin peptidase)/N-methyltransferase